MCLTPHLPHTACMKRFDNPVAVPVATLVFGLLLTACALRAQTGRPVPSLSAFDQTITRLMDKYQLPGGALALAKDGRLVYARGFGLADRDSQTAVQPDSLFRVGSLSKPLTAMAVLKLMEEGKLSLDSPVLQILGEDLFPTANLADQRWRQVTLRHLLQHSGGWDSDLSFDPLELSLQQIKDLGWSLPPSPREVLHFLAAQPLHFTPGTRYAYSNIGYYLLGRVIEQVSGQKYADHIQQHVLQPMGITRAGFAGISPSRRLPGEVSYYDYPGAPLLPDVYRPLTAAADGKLAPAPDGGAFSELIEGAGTLVISVIDYVRFVNSLDGHLGTPFLKPETMRLMAQPAPFDRNAQVYHGLGWTLQPAGSGYNWFYQGQASGTFAVILRVEELGVAWTVAFNSAPPPELLEEFENEVGNGLALATLGVAAYPLEPNLFESYHPANTPRLDDAGVVSAASWLPGAALPGQVLDVFGSGFTADSLVLVDGEPITPLEASGRRITFALPASVAGRSEVRIEVQAAAVSNALTIPLTESAPGLFTASGNGRGPAAAMNEDGRQNSALQPAARGSVAVLFATGLSATRPVELSLAGQPAEVLNALPVADEVTGLWLIVIRVPVELPPGDLPVVLSQGSAATRAGVTLWVD